MTQPSDSRWSWQAIAFIVFAAVLGTAVSRYASRVLDRLDGQFGYRPNPAGVAEFLRELPQPRFRDAGAECMRAKAPADTFLYRFTDQASQAVYGKPFESWNQGNAGTCVSMGFGLGSWTGQSVDWVMGELSEPPLMVDTSVLYAGSRTYARLPPVTNAGYGDGSYGGAAARWISGRCKDGAVGGILYRTQYGPYDLRQYSIAKSRDWGNTGPPRDLAIEASKHRARAVALVDTWDELVASISSGYPVAICSNVGFAATSVRDRDGFLPAGSTWNHCMLVWAVRLADGPGKRDGGLIQNSWQKNWVSGPKWPSDQPDGSFWASRGDLERILRQGDSWSIGGVDGFKARDLDHRKWLMPPPPAPDVSQAKRIDHALAL